MSFIIKYNDNSWTMDRELLSKKSELFTALSGSGFKEDNCGEYEIRGEFTTTAVEDFVTYIQGQPIEIKQLDRLFEFLNIANYFLTDLSDFLDSNESFLDTIRTVHPSTWNQLCEISNMIKQQLMAKFYIFKFTIKNDYKFIRQKFGIIGKIKCLYTMLQQFDYEVYLHVTSKGINLINNEVIIGNIDGLDNFFFANDHIFKFTKQCFEILTRFIYLKCKEMTVICYRNIPNETHVNFLFSKGIQIVTSFRNSFPQNIQMSPMVDMKHIISFTLSKKLIRDTFGQYSSYNSVNFNKMIIENGLVIITTNRDDEKIKIPILTQRIEKKYTFNMADMNPIHKYAYNFLRITFHLMAYEEENYLKVNVLLPELGQLNFVVKQL